MCLIHKAGWKGLVLKKKKRASRKQNTNTLKCWRFAWLWNDLFPSSPKNVPILHCWLNSEFLPKVLSTESQLCPILIRHPAHCSSRSLFSYMYLCVFGPINFITNFLRMRGSILNFIVLAPLGLTQYFIIWPHKSPTFTLAGGSPLETDSHHIYSILILNF